LCMVLPNHIFDHTDSLECANHTLGTEAESGGT
jgi:hypothetical protein